MEIAIVLKAPEIKDDITEKQIIFADGGYEYKDKIKGKTVLAVVGDFDSLKKIPQGEKIVKLEVEKDFTDGERAVRLAVECGATQIIIYGGFGGKIEHVLGNIALLKIAKILGVKALIKDGNRRMQLISDINSLSVRKGCTLSLIPYGGDCAFKRSKGLYYPLDGLTLTSADTRGISNVAIDGLIDIEVEKGESLIVYEI